MPNLRGQIIFRKAIGATRQESSPHKTQDQRFFYSLGVGIIEFDAGATPVEQVLPFVISKQGGALSTLLPNKGLPAPSYAHANDLGGILSDMNIETPFLGHLLTCGGLFVRRTRFPSPEGRETCAVAALIRSPADFLPERQMFTLEPDRSGRLFFSNPTPIPKAFPLGSTITQTYGLPIWGFGEEKRGIYSTLTLEAIDACHELNQLRRVSDPTSDQRARMRLLDRSDIAGGILNVSKGDEMFTRFVEICEERGIKPPRFDTYPTATEIASRDAAVSEIVKELVHDGQAPSFAP